MDKNQKVLELEGFGNEFPGLRRLTPDIDERKRLKHLQEVARGYGHLGLDQKFKKKKKKRGWIMIFCVVFYYDYDYQCTEENMNGGKQLRVYKLF